VAKARPAQPFSTHGKRLRGTCDVPNVVEINSEAGSQWFGNITEFNQYRSLVDWAARSVHAGHLLELPREFKDHRFLPWR